MRVHILCGLMIATLALAVSNGVAFAGPLEDAHAAYNRGDYVAAIQLYKPLAAKGNVDAQTNIGWMFQNGQGVPRDYDEAIKWYRLAATQGGAYAQVNLGVSYEYGNGVPKNDKEAVKWYRLATAQGLADAQNHLGVMYENGNGVPKNDKEAVSIGSRLHKEMHRGNSISV
jgi:TPR repeat protein